MRATVLLLPLVVGCALDPLLTHTKLQRRSLECVSLAQQDAADRFPGQVPPLNGKELAGNTSRALICERAYFEPGERDPRDEAILSTLTEQLSGLTQHATLELGEVTWHVDAYYPSAPVAQKIAVAARSQLAERGFAVSDRVPVLAAGDVAVLARLPQSEVYRVACARSYATKVLGERDALLGVVLIDASETRLHGGVCWRGTWRWLS